MPITTELLVQLLSIFRTIIATLIGVLSDHHLADKQDRFDLAGPRSDILDFMEDISAKITRKGRAVNADATEFLTKTDNVEYYFGKDVVNIKDEMYQWILAMIRLSKIEAECRWTKADSEECDSQYEVARQFRRRLAKAKEKYLSFSKNGIVC